MAPSWGIVVFWFSMLVAWLIKLPIVRYGGMRTFLLLRPFFMSFIFGEFLAACMWSLIAWFWQLPTPTFPWPKSQQPARDAAEKAQHGVEEEHFVPVHLEEVAQDEQVDKPRHNE